jgi:hypothetical protein
MPPCDPFDPDHPPPHWIDEEGNFAGWMSEAEAAEMLRRSFEDHVASIALCCAHLNTSLPSMIFRRGRAARANSSRACAGVVS